jgi:UDP-N-acetylmuramyl tripeptide synthase
VDHIVLEIARGGIVRRVIGVDEVDVGVLLNIGEDHLGTDWLVYEGLIKGGFQEQNIEIIPERSKAVDFLFSKAKTGDLLVIQPDELEPVMGQIMERYRQMVTHI